MLQPAIDVHIGERLRFLREQHGLSQAAFAGACDLSIAALADRETGSARMDLGSLLRSAELLNVPLRAFFEGEADWTGGRARSAPDRPLLVDREILLLVDTLKNADLRRRICEALVDFAVSNRSQLVADSVGATPVSR